MKLFIFITGLLGLLSCNGQQANKPSNEDLESLAFEGISIDFQFKSDKPILSDLFLLVGYEDKKIPAKNRAFEKMQDLGFEQVDDYFGIRNETQKGDDVKLWLLPIISGNEVYNNQGPFDAIRLSYVVVRNEPETAILFKKAFEEITTKLNVTPVLNGKVVKSYSEVETLINQTIQFCREELKVEPGSEEALLLEW